MPDLTDLVTSGGVLETLLTDADGVGHAYIVPKMPAEHGLDVIARLLAYGAEPILTALGSVRLDGLGDRVRGALAAEEDTGGDGTTLATILGGVDLGALGPGLRASLLTVQARPLVASLLVGVRRDGHALVEGGRLTAAFNAAYARNYMELGRALWAVAAHNRLFPQPGT